MASDPVVTGAPATFTPVGGVALSGLTMLGDDAALCVDGVCAVPSGTPEPSDP